MKGVRKHLEMVNQLAKLLSSLADVTSSIRELLVKKKLFCWSKAFVKIQRCLSDLPVLFHYNPNNDTIVAANS